MRERRARIRAGRSLALALALSVAASGWIAGRASAATLLLDPLGFSPSFWQLDNWIPDQVPGAGDSVTLHGSRFVGHTLYLGETVGEPAQTRTIQRLFVTDSSPGWVLAWGSDIPGGAAGGLRFSQDDPADFGVGLRVASQFGTPTGERIELTLADAENAPSDAFTIALGMPAPAWQPASAGEANALTLVASDTTLGAAIHQLHANEVRLEGDYSELHIQANTALSANRVTALGNRGSQIDVNRGTLIATDVELEMLGAGNVPLLVRDGGTALLDRLTLRAAFPGNATTARFENALGTIGSLELQAFERGSVAFEVDGALAAVDVDTFLANAADGPIALRVLNGGRLTIDPRNVAVMAADRGPSGTGAISVQVDGLGSTLAGWFRGDARFELSNGGRCNGCTLNLFSGGSARFLSGSVLDGGQIVSGGDVTFVGSEIRNANLFVSDGATLRIADTTAASVGDLVVWGSTLPGGPTSSAVIRSTAPGIDTVVSARTVRVDATFALDGGAPVGGEGPGVTRASLNLGNGARLHVGPDPIGTTWDPLLAIGRDGSVTLDATSAVFIGDGLTAPSYQAGAIVVDDGGNLYGTGTINGTGFPSGVHPNIVNTGGNVRSGFSPGTLTIEGAYVQESGTLTLEIGGVNAGQFDVLDAVQGASFLGGTLRFERIDGFTGVLGAQLDFFAGRAVSFAPSLVIEDDTGFDLAFDFATGIATITRVVPEPPIAALLAAGCAGLGWIGRRRKPRRGSRGRTPLRWGIGGGFALALASISQPSSAAPYGTEAVARVGREFRPVGGSFFPSRVCPQGGCEETERLNGSVSAHAGAGYVEPTGAASAEGIASLDGGQLRAVAFGRDLTCAQAWCHSALVEVAFYDILRFNRLNQAETRIPSAIVLSGDFLMVGNPNTSTWPAFARATATVSVWDLGGVSVLDDWWRVTLSGARLIYTDTFVVEPQLHRGTIAIAPFDMILPSERTQIGIRVALRVEAGSAGRNTSTDADFFNTATLHWNIPTDEVEYVGSGSGVLNPRAIPTPEAAPTALLCAGLIGLQLERARKKLTPRTSSACSRR